MKRYYVEVEGELSDGTKIERSTGPWVTWEDARRVPSESRDVS